MRLKKFLLTPALALLAAGSLTGCGGSGEFVIWTFSPELKKIVQEYYGGRADVVVKTSVVQVRNDLNNSIRSGKNIPDVVALEAAVIADFTSKTADEAVLQPLDDIQTGDMYAYTKSVATSTDGKVLGLSWQATPGGFFYKEDIAAKLGINSIREMEAQISTWDGYLALAERAKNYSEYEIAICSSIIDPVKVFLSSRENPWVVDRYLQTESVMFGGSEGHNCFDLVRELQQKGYTHETADRGSGWVADIDSNNTLGYFCSSWGLNFDLMPKANTSFGKWKMCKAPVDYFNGGTWLAIPKGAKNAAKAHDFIKYITTDKDFLKDRGKKTGDFMNSKSVMQEISIGYQCEFLGGQNHLSTLLGVADNINGELISPYDATINGEFEGAVSDFARDKRDVEKARREQLSNFVNNVQAKYPALLYDDTKW